MENLMLYKRGFSFDLILLLLCLLVSSKTTASDLNDYKLGADDVISVNVFNEADLSLAEARVSNSGTIAMPLIGQINVRGLNTSQVEEKIHDLYLGDYLKKPNINVSIVEYRQFYVNGEVEKPGGYSYREGMTIERAVTLAGGFTVRASRSSIRLVSEDGTRKIESAELSSAVKPGDVITVQESFF